MTGRRYRRNYLGLLLPLLLLLLVVLEIFYLNHTADVIHSNNLSYQRIQGSGWSRQPLFLQECVQRLRKHIEELQRGRSVNYNDEIQKLIEKKKNYFSVAQPGQQTCVEYSESLAPRNSVRFIGETVGEMDVKRLVEADLSKLESLYSNTVYGGGWAPLDGARSSGVAIIIPMRERWTQLAKVLSTLLPLLQRQRVCYRIFVIEQMPGSMFNRAKLLNIGFVEALKRFHFECVIFQDADVMPLNDCIPYDCDNNAKQGPIHLATRMSNLNFELPYPQFAGGVLKMTTSHFFAINGYSNLYWGWGGEDDNLFKRIIGHSLTFRHADPGIARFDNIAPSIGEKSNKLHQLNLLLLNFHRSTARYDGLNSLHYTIVDEQLHTLFTKIVVDVGKEWDCVEPEEIQ